MTRWRWLVPFGALLVFGVIVALAVSEQSEPDATPVVSAIPEGEEGEELIERDRWFYEQRVAVGQDVPDDAFISARSVAATDRDTSAVPPLVWSELGPHPIGAGGPEPNDDLDWVYGGPTPYSGRVSSIAHHPSDSRTAYIGTSGGGVWKTSDDGVTWTPLFDSQPSLAIGAVAVDPNNPDTIYAGTGESNRGTPAYFGAGLFRSAKAGEEWERLAGPTFDECHIPGIGVKQGDSNVILVAANGHGRNRWERWSDRCSDRTGIWLSKDGGKAFTRVLDERFPTDLAHSPNDPEVWYAAFDSAGVFKSNNSGETWTKLAAFPIETDTGRIDIDVAASKTTSDQVAYAAVANSEGELQGVFRSLDSGGTWEQLDSPRPFEDPETGTEDNGCGRQCWYDLAVAADPADPTRGYFGGVYLNRYDGKSPSLVLWKKIHVDFHALSFDRSGRLWLGSDGGIYRTSDRGATVDNLNADLGTAIIYPGISGRASGPLYAGMQDNGSARHGGSPDWTFVNWGDGFFTATDPKNANLAYVESQFLNIRKLTSAVPGGWCAIREIDGLDDAASIFGRAPFNAPLVMHPTDPTVMYAGSYRIWKTTNATSPECGATTWSLDSQDFDNWVTAIGPAPSSTSIAYAASAPARTAGAGLYVTTGSTEWTNTQPNGLPADRYFTDIAVHPTSPETAWVTVSGFVDGAHLYGTTDQGKSWVDLDNGLPNAPANAIVVDTRTSSTRLYVGTDVGVYVSGDGGATWDNVGGNLPNAGVMDLLLDTSANQIIAATFGRGAWFAPLTQP